MSLSVRYPFVVTLLAVLTFALYAPSIFHGFFIIDDGKLILANAAVHGVSFSNLWQIFTSYDPELYIPLTLFTFQVEYQLFGAYPVPYHLVNVLLHTVNTLLLLWWMNQFTQQRWLSMLVAALYGLHPLQAEAVLWISARKDLLSAFFVHLTILTYLYYQKQGSLRLYVSSVIFFLLALLSKISPVMLPLGLLLMDYYRTGPQGTAMLKDKWWYFVVAGVLLLVGLFGKVGVLQFYEIGLLEMLLLASRSAVQYVWLTVNPFALAKIYPYVGSLYAPELWLSLLGVGLAAFWFEHCKWNQRAVFFGGFWFLFLLLPSLTTQQRLLWDGFVLAVDRFAYLPIIGLFFLVAYGVVRLWERCGHIVTVVSVFVLTGLTVITSQRVALWSDSRAVLQEVLVTYPNAYVAERILARHDIAAGHYQPAIEKLEALLARVPTDDQSRALLATLYRWAGDAAAATAQLEHIDSRNQRGQIVRAELALDREDHQLAAQVLEDLGPVGKTYPEWYRIQARIAYLKGDIIGARKTLEQGITRYPLDMTMKAALARLLSTADQSHNFLEEELALP